MQLVCPGATRCPMLARLDTSNQANFIVDDIWQVNRLTGWQADCPAHDATYRMPSMSQNELSSATTASSAPRVAPGPQAADTAIERRYPSDIDRLREVVGADVLPFYRDEQAVIASQQAGERWPHLVAFADSRAAALIDSASSLPTGAA